MTRLSRERRLAKSDDEKAPITQEIAAHRQELDHYQKLLIAGRWKIR
jgi:hypothetical protein